MFKSLFKSFKNAIRGIVICFYNERNFRIHIVALIYVLPFSIIYGLSITELAILFIVFSLVLFAELINSSIEEMLNIQVNCYNSFARNAKDIAAGAVLVTAIFSVVIAILFFKEIEGWKNIINFLFYCNPFNFIILFLTIFLSIFFIKGKTK